MCLTKKTLKQGGDIGKSCRQPSGVKRAARCILKRCNRGSCVLKKKKGEHKMVELSGHHAALLKERILKGLVIFVSGIGLMVVAEYLSAVLYQTGVVPFWPQVRYFLGPFRHVLYFILMMCVLGVFWGLAYGFKRPARLWYPCALLGVWFIVFAGFVVLFSIGYLRF